MSRELTMAPAGRSLPSTATARRVHDRAGAPPPCSFTRVGEAHADRVPGLQARRRAAVTGSAVLPGLRRCTWASSEPRRHGTAAGPRNMRGSPALLLERRKQVRRGEMERSRRAGWTPGLDDRPAGSPEAAFGNQVGEALPRPWVVEVDRQGSALPRNRLAPRDGVRDQGVEAGAQLWAVRPWSMREVRASCGPRAVRREGRFAGPWHEHAGTRWRWTGRPR